MIVLALLSALAGFAALALAMDRHHGEMLHRRLQRAVQVRLRWAGAATIALSYLIMLRALGAIVGSIAWFGVLSLAAAAVLLTISARAARQQTAKHNRYS